MRHRAALVVAPLRAHVVEARAVATSTSITLLNRAAAGPDSRSVISAPFSTFTTWWSVASDVSLRWR
jgi:hypothetical protein